MNTVDKLRTFFVINYFEPQKFAKSKGINKYSCKNCYVCSNKYEFTTMRVPK